MNTADYCLEPSSHPFERRIACSAGFLWSGMEAACLIVDRAAESTAPLPDGDTVLDLGSGGGIDVLLSARRVGATGKAYGLDMTDELLDLARRNAAEAGMTNFEFLKGQIEAVPLLGQPYFVT